MLGVWVIIYFIFTLSIAFAGSRKNRTTEEYALAGRRMPVYITAFALFATWFGAETVMGASGSFLDEGLFGILEDPIGAFLCLCLVGLFYARPLYSRGYLSLADFIRDRYGRVNERVFSILLVLSYLSWIAGQMTALAYIFELLFPLSFVGAMITACALVVIFTMVGGMWAISVTDFVQSILIIAGLLFALGYVSEQAGGIEVVLEHAAGDRWSVRGAIHRHGIWEMLAALLTLGLGSIPSQDIFQRLSTAKSARAAVLSSFMGAGLYLVFSFLPLLLGVAATLVSHGGAVESSEKTILQVIMGTGNGWIQVMFFGALLSAIVSTASAALLAPAVVIGENIMKPLSPLISDKQLLYFIRAGIVIMGLFALLLSFWKESIFELAALSSSFTLVSLFATLTLGLFWKRATARGSLYSMGSGLLSWVGAIVLGTDFPPLLIGLGISMLVHVVVDINFPDESIAARSYVGQNNLS